MTRDGGTNSDRWRIHAGNTTYYVADQDEPHPVLVDTWTSFNGASGTPQIGVSRTGNIERVRKAQRDFVKSDSRAFTIDTRGLERDMDAGGGDFVHMTNTGYAGLADRFVAAYGPWNH